MNQAAVAALLSLLLGIFFGIVYDIIRFFRVVLGVDVSNPFVKGKLTLHKLFGFVFVTLGDLFFFAVATVSMCIFLFLTGDGRFRWYVLLGIILGFWAYYNTVGKLFIKIAEKIISGLKKLFRFMLLPLLRLFELLKKLYARIFDMPIVKAYFKRYNEYITKRKKVAVARKKSKMRKKGCCFTNGGTHG